MGRLWSEVFLHPLLSLPVHPGPPQGLPTGLALWSLGNRPALASTTIRSRGALGLATLPLWGSDSSVCVWKGGCLCTYCVLE